MLSFLKIRNLALVDDLTWEIGPGLVAVTGETGAGKSIIVGALKLLLGDRADRSLIRTGEDSCTVEAGFQLPDAAAINAILEESGLDPCEDGELILRRSIGAKASSRQFVNCSPVTLQVLKRLGEFLVDLHGPHDHQSLHSQERQRVMLDRHAGAEAKREKYQACWRAWREAVEELQELQVSERAGEQQIDMLRFQVEEIAAAELRPGEEEELEARHRLAANATRLAEVSGGLLEHLGEGAGGIQAALQEVVRLAGELERIDPQTAELFAGLESAQIELRELEQSVQDYAGGIEVHPQELAELDQRLTLLQSLKRKYGATVEEVQAFHDEAAQKLARMENRGEELERLEAEVAARRQKLDAAGQTLGKERRRAAPKLAKQIAGHLEDLGFKQSVFEVHLRASEEPTAGGFEEVDFQFAPNPGEPLKPLRLTASSGEMSRVLLSVKSALANQDAVPLLVFDEIDANVGGNIAEAVGRKMSQLGETHQVIAITHFPQVASLAGHHYQVRKLVEGKRTRSTLESIAEDERVEELARMLGGSADSARAHARSLLQGAA